MTVQNTIVKNIYVGNGSTTVFPYTFYLPEGHGEYIKVYIVPETGSSALTDNYTLDEENKSVIYPASGSPLPAGTKLVIARELPLFQLLNLVNGGAYFADDIETALDELTMMLQQTEERLARALSVGIGTSSNVVLEIPNGKGMSFRWSDDGTKLEITEDPARVMSIVAAQTEQTIASAAAAKTSETNAAASEKDAAASATAAAKSEANALSYKNAAENSKTAAQQSASTAITAATSSAENAGIAEDAAELATQKAADASTSEANALSYKNAAAMSEANAADSKNTAVAAKNTAVAAKDAILAYEGIFYYDEEGYLCIRTEDDFNGA